MKTEGRREGRVRYVRPGSIFPELHDKTNECLADGCYPVYVQPLVEGEPVPGETWQHLGNDVEIVTAPYSDQRYRTVVVRDSTGGTREVDIEWLTRAPETREVEVTFSMSAVPGGTRYTRLTVPASMSDDDLMAAIRGAVEVEPT